MKAQELRLGNLIYNSVGIVTDVTLLCGKIISISDSKKVNEADATPIPLTEKWLLKFGFRNNGQNMYDLDGWIPCLREMRLKEARWYQVYNVADCGIAYVHELQNLYFALTGKELPITP